METLKRVIKNGQSKDTQKKQREDKQSRNTTQTAIL